MRSSRRSAPGGAGERFDCRGLSVGRCLSTAQTPSGGSPVSMRRRRSGWNLFPVAFLPSWQPRSTVPSEDVSRTQPSETNGEGHLRHTTGRSLTGNVQRLAAFTTTPDGGNPAGVWIGHRLPDRKEMQAIAADIGYSETVFAAPTTGAMRIVRYYSPMAEVPFCGHATIALGVALGTAGIESTYRRSTHESGSSR